MFLYPFIGNTIDHWQLSTLIELFKEMLKFFQNNFSMNKNNLKENKEFLGIFCFLT
jgi:hypothetical protein